MTSPCRQQSLLRALPLAWWCAALSALLASCEPPSSPAGDPTHSWEASEPSPGSAAPPALNPYWEAPAADAIGQPEPESAPEAGSLPESAPPTEPESDVPTPRDAEGEPTDDVEESTSDTAPPPEPIAQPALYPNDSLISPITPFVAQHLVSIAESAPSAAPDVFMKVGASSTVSGYNLKCFSSNSVALESFGGLESTLEWFNAGDAAGDTPFARASLAAKVGMSAGWAVSGDPSPITQEITAIQPAFAFVHYGANDMHLGSSFESAIYKFANRMVELTDELTAQGIVPILATITPRDDVDDANLWVPTYCAVIRGVAQGRQVPLMDLHLAAQPLPGWGLASDGLHPNVYKDGSGANACAFTDQGLEYGYNIRNLTSLLALDAVHQAVNLAQGGLEDAATLVGQGSHEAPFEMAALPFSDLRSTLESPNDVMDTYPGCDATQDESGPEYVYSLLLDSPRSIRALVFDQGEVDIDLHLLEVVDGQPTCIERDHQIIQRTLPAGEYRFVLDTYVSSSGEMAGEYLFVVVPCEPGDPSCP